MGQPTVELIQAARAAAVVLTTGILTWQPTIQFDACLFDHSMTAGSQRLSVFSSGSRSGQHHTNRAGPSRRGARPSVLPHPAPCCCQIAQRTADAHGRRGRPHRPPAPPQGRLPVRAGLLRLSSLPHQLRSFLLSQGNPPSSSVLLKRLEIFHVSVTYFVYGCSLGG